MRKFDANVRRDEHRINQNTLEQQAVEPDAQETTQSLGDSTHSKPWFCRICHEPCGDSERSRQRHENTHSKKERQELADARKASENQVRMGTVHLESRDKYKAYKVTIMEDGTEYVYAIPKTFTKWAMDQRGWREGVRVRFTSYRSEQHSLNYAKNVEVER